MGMRTKFFTYILLIVFVPITISIFVFIFSMSSIMKNFDDDSAIETNFYLLEQAIRDNYSIIEDPSQFYDSLNPFLEEYKLQLHIETNDGIRIFDSREFADKSVLEDESFLNGFDRFNTYSISIFDNNKKVATAIIEGNSNSQSAFAVNGKLIYSIMISVISGLVTFVLLITLFIIFVSKNILTPIEQLNSATLLASEGDFSYHLTYHSRSEIGQLTAAFKEMRQRIEENINERKMHEQSRKELIASISHDLRTPLASIQGYVEALQDGLATDEAMKNKYLVTIQTKTKQVNRLIDDLFEFSKLDLQQLKMDMQQIDSSFLSEMFIQIEADVLQLGSNITVDLSIPSKRIEIDPERIAQVLHNIVNNALRYIDKDTGMIFLRAYVEGNYFVIEVKDNGTGIDPKDLPHIFDRFYRGEKSRSRCYGGAGLGLAISKAIVKANNGNISVSSKLGVGTTFKIKLPILKKIIQSQQSDI